MAVKDNQLARIVAPGLNEVDYSDKMAIAFSNINENFKKIASLPFLQGVAGDSYQLQEYKIIVKQNDPETDDLTINNTLCLTKEGASLFNTIFDTNIFTEGNYFNDICDNTDINKDLNGKKVLDFFIDENGNIINNKLYFYVIKNDADEVIEDSKHLGQYFYFIDGRIKELGNAYYNTDKTSITDFNDYSGFFQYNPETETYYRVDILPTLYYDAAKNDICWKFYGKETGISAIGVAGANGNDATFQFVKVKPTNESDCSAKIEYIFDFNAQNTTDYWIPVNNSDILNGPAVISIETQDNKSIAFGQIMGETAYWDNNTVLNNLVTSETISKYFYNMGFNQGNYPLFLAIPMSYNRNDNNPEKNNAHTIYSNEDSDLVFRGVENAWIGSDGIQQNYKATTGDIHNIVLENYNLNLNKNDISNVNTLSGNEINFGNANFNNVTINEFLNTKEIKTEKGNITDLTCTKITASEGDIDTIESNSIDVLLLNSDNIINSNEITSGGDIIINNNVILTDKYYGAGKAVVEEYWFKNDDTKIKENTLNVYSFNEKACNGGFTKGYCGIFTSINNNVNIIFPKCTYTIKRKTWQWSAGYLQESYINNIKFSVYLINNTTKTKTEVYTKTFSNITIDEDNLGYGTSSTKEHYNTKVISIDGFDKNISVTQGYSYKLYVDFTYTADFDYYYQDTYGYQDYGAFKPSAITCTIKQSEQTKKDSKTIVFKNGIVSGLKKECIGGIIASDSGTLGTYLFTTYKDGNNIYYKQKSISDIIGSVTPIKLE